MGCDIHIYSEKRKRKRSLFNRIFGKAHKWAIADKEVKNKWYPDYESEPEFVIKSPYSGGRNYNLFAALAGVRAFCFKNQIQPVSMPKGIPGDISVRVKQEVDNWGVDGHSHTYLSLCELKAYDWQPWGDTCNAFLDEIIPHLQGLEEQGNDARLVFFFDN